MANSNKTSMTELIGLEVVIEEQTGDKAAYVAQADREKGITLHYLDNDEEAYCINKDFILNHIQIRSDRNRVYHEAFTRLVREILSGRIVTSTNYHRNGWVSTYNMRNKNYQYFTPIRCAFK